MAVSAGKDGWMHAHNSLRDEMRNLVEALEVTHGRRASLEEWEVKCIKRAWAAHEVHVHSHHNNEDAIMVPYLETRFKYPDKVCFHTSIILPRARKFLTYIFPCSTKLITKHW